MFKPVVGGSGKNKVGPAELLDVSQSLELGRVDDLDEKRVELNVTMDGVIEDLLGQTGLEFRSNSTPCCVLYALIHSGGNPKNIL